MALHWFQFIIVHVWLGQAFLVRDFFDYHPILQTKPSLAKNGWNRQT
jgi:hypothetical protein